mmetsp:Transcript_16104/g.29296  ORF Transcript_16104/g.29296 Transcript_16104/m.29296 type:complete len:99 (+) Transcript_16104:148-444(+)
MWFHAPSFIVGSFVSGTSFLIVHRELSHRTRLTHKWIIQEMVEEQWKTLRSSNSNDANPGKPVVSAATGIAPFDSLEDATIAWNKGINQLRDFTKGGD